MILTKERWMKILYLKEKELLKLTDDQINEIYWSNKIRKKFLNEIRRAEASQFIPVNPIHGELTWKKQNTN